MPPHLIFVFLLMSGLAYAFAWFFAGIVFRDTPIRSIRRFRNGLAAFTCLFPLLAFALYYKSLPTDGRWVTAFYPALWAFMVLSAMVAGISISRRNG